MGIFKHSFFLSMALLTSLGTYAQRDDYRGGWIAEIDGTSHIFHIVIREEVVSGIFCFDCESTSNLSFIDDGALENEILTFTLYHSPTDEPPFTEKVIAYREGNNLEVTRQRFGLEKVDVVTYKRQSPDPKLDSLATYPAPPGNRESILPGTPETISSEKIIGTWLWGAGPGKQIFMFKKHKEGIRGMVCGPCDRLDAIAPLENISWEGINLHFDIVHEDGGPGYEEFGPHSNVTDATIAKHEMHMDVVPTYEIPDFSPIKMTLVGPIINY